jgi:DNA-binding MarR family transcriptional regulator
MAITQKGPFIVESERQLVMASDKALRLDNQLCFPLYAASRMIIRLYRPVLEPLGLTYTQYITLLALWEHDDETVKALGQRLYLDSGTLTPLLKKLEAQGIVERERSSEDERSVRIRLTESGRALKKQAAEVPQKVASCISLPAQDALELHRLLHQLLADGGMISCNAPTV